MRIPYFLHRAILHLPLSWFVFFGVCPECLRHDMSVARRRTRTMYHHEESNFEVSCIDCFEEHDNYWRERWDDYYANCL